jgi:hypothetical protein
MTNKIYILLRFDFDYLGPEGTEALNAFTSYEEAEREVAAMFKEKMKYEGLVTEDQYNAMEVLVNKYTIFNGDAWEELMESIEKDNEKWYEFVNQHEICSTSVLR